MQHSTELAEGAPPGVRGCFLNARHPRTARNRITTIPGAPRYLTIYRIEADNVMDAYAQLGEATRGGKVVITDVIRSDPPSTFLVHAEI